MLTSLQSTMRSCEKIIAGVQHAVYASVLPTPKFLPQHHSSCGALASGKASWDKLKATAARDAPGVSDDREEAPTRRVTSSNIDP